MFRNFATATAIAALTSTTAFGVVIYDETIDGPLSGSVATPTDLGSLSSGTNSLIGGFAGGFARDAWSVTIPTGFQLDAINLAQYDGGDTTGLSSDTTGDSLIISAASVGSNVSPAPATEYQAGTYVFSMVETVALDYQLDFILGAAPTVDPDAIWDETFDGDGSDVTTASTAVTLNGVGSNKIIASVGGSDSRDTFTFTIPNGLSLAAGVLEAFSTTDGNTTGIDIYSGTTVASGTKLADGLAGTGFVGDDLFFGTSPFGPGTYTLEFLEFGSSVDIALDLQIVPEPASLALLGLGGIAMLGRRRAR